MNTKDLKFEKLTETEYLKVAIEKTKQELKKLEKKLEDVNKSRFIEGDLLQCEGTYYLVTYWEDNWYLTNLSTGVMSKIGWYGSYTSYAEVKENFSSKNFKYVGALSKNLVILSS